MYTVIGSPKTRAFRVLWMLNELGQPYSVDPLPPRDPKLAGINPSMKVPVLKDGDNYVIDSVAICQYLADKHQMLTFPAGTINRAHQDSFTQFCVDELELPLWVAAKHKFALPEKWRVPEVKPACEFDFNRGLTALGERLGSKTYVMGDVFTVPDLLLGHCSLWASSAGWTAPGGPVADYFARVQARPAFKKALAEREAA
jgi:glutathione S-transferase